MILIVASKKDIAGINIAEEIINQYNFERSEEVFRQNHVYEKKLQNREFKLVFVNEDSFYAQYITNFFVPELLLFVSKHSSVSGIPTFSVHVPGNIGKAEMGGISKQVSVSPANTMRETLVEMARLRDEMKVDYQVSYECTHHGPSVNVPTMFVEVGGSLKNWKDSQAVEIVAHSTMIACSKETNYPSVLGIGGQHYNEKFTKMAFNTQTAFGHIIPKYAISDLDFEMIEQCVKKTVGKVQKAVLDWKGIKSINKKKLITMLIESGLSIEKI